jgi:hypothetical protein
VAALLVAAPLVVAVGALVEPLVVAPPFKSPATKARYQVKLAPSSNHAAELKLVVKKFHAVWGSEIARLA